MDTIRTLKGASGRWERPTLEEQADTAERMGVETLFYCKNPWALRHKFLNHDTGEMIRTRCNRWGCSHCGPRKVDLWRQLVKVAEPTLFLTLSKAGNTVEEAARALTTFMQALRRGSKGRGPNKKGARVAYPVEYFAVLERHTNFEENGFHWHLLLRGVERIPYKDVIQPLWRSARHGKAEIGHIERIRNARAIGYVTKYLTKCLTLGEKGFVEVKQTRIVTELEQVSPSEYRVKTDEQGHVILTEQEIVGERASKAHRIRYSRQFFPASVATLRAALFEGMEQESPQTPAVQEQMSMQEQPPTLLVDEEQKDEQEREEVPARSPWRLVETKAFTNDLGVYAARQREALLAALDDLTRGKRSLSRRVIHVWAYQQRELHQSLAEKVHQRRA